MRYGKVRHNFGFGVFPFLFAPTNSVARTWLSHSCSTVLNTVGRQVTVHRDVVVKFLIIHATELSLVVLKSIIVIFIPHYDVTNT
jgi:hypothetical protein